mgnify:CR=1 FL=1
MMRVLHNNVLVTQDSQKETTTESGLILTGAKPSGHTPAKVIGMSIDIAQLGTIEAGSTVLFDWSKSTPVELDGVACAVIDYGDIKLVM